jgi:L-threonylcarbamoyladenylate synthase
VVLSITRVIASETSIEEAAERLRKGLLVAFPTETVYGLGARVSDVDAIARIFAAKKRPSGHPLIAHVLGEDDAKTLASEWPAPAHVLVEKFWPGPVTVVVSRSNLVPDIVTGGLGTVAIRAPAHPVARALIEKVGPIVAPSANMHQALSPTRAEDVHVEGDVLVLDGGACTRGIESTVIDVRSRLILRPGPISRDAIRAIGIDVDVASATVASSEARPSPGMDERHYAPRATLLVSNNDAEARLLVSIHRAALLDLGDDPEVAMRELYMRLHDLDARGVAVIVVRMPPENEAWRGVRDRIERASKR